MHDSAEWQTSACRLRPALTRTLRIGSLAAGLLLVAAAARADEIRVAATNAIATAYRELIPEFERATGHTIVTEYGGSTGTAPDAIPTRLQRGERYDVVIVSAAAVDDLTAQGRLVAGSRVDLVRSAIGMAVRAGARHPDISTVDALTRTLLNAKTVAYSSSASGAYLMNDLFPRLGIAAAIAAKSKPIDSVPVAEVIARGDAEIGFQQISELRGVNGVDVVGPLPPGAQRITVFAAAIVSGAAHADAARALITFLAAPSASAAYRRSGLEPAAAGQP